MCENEVAPERNVSVTVIVGGFAERLSAETQKIAASGVPSMLNESERHGPVLGVCKGFVKTRKPGPGEITVCEKTIDATKQPAFYHI